MHAPRPNKGVPEGIAIPGRPEGQAQQALQKQGPKKPQVHAEQAPHCNTEAREPITTNRLRTFIYPVVIILCVGATIRYTAHSDETSIFLE
jgi:hypothetical protein